MEKLYVDQQVCIGCELCVQICPEIFSMNTLAKAQVTGELSATLKAKAVDAVDNCPMNCVYWKN